IPPAPDHERGRMPDDDGPRGPRKYGPSAVNQPPATGQPPRPTGAAGPPPQPPAGGSYPDPRQPRRPAPTNRDRVSGQGGFGVQHDRSAGNGYPPAAGGAPRAGQAGQAGQPRRPGSG